MTMAAGATSKLLNMGKNPSIRSLIHSNLRRAPLVSTTTTQISQSSTPGSQIPILFDREVPGGKKNAHAAGEVLKLMTHSLGVSVAAAVGLPGIDQSERIMKYYDRQNRPVSDDDDDDDDDNLDDLDYDDDDGFPDHHGSDSD